MLSRWWEVREAGWGGPGRNPREVLPKPLLRHRLEFLSGGIPFPHNFSEKQEFLGITGE